MRPLCLHSVRSHLVGQNSLHDGSPSFRPFGSVPESWIITWYLESRCDIVFIFLFIHPSIQSSTHSALPSSSYHPPMLLIHLSFLPSIPQPAHASSIHPSIHPPIHPSSIHYLSIHPSFLPFIHPLTHPSFILPLIQLPIHSSSIYPTFLPPLQPPMHLLPLLSSVVTSFSGRFYPHGQKTGPKQL